MMELKCIATMLITSIQASGNAVITLKNPDNHRHTTAVLDINSNIKTALENNTHEIAHLDKKINLPPSIREEIKIKRRLRSLWQRTRNPDIKTLVNRQTAKVKELLNTTSRNWCNFLGKIEANSIRLDQTLQIKPSTTA